MSNTIIQIKRSELNASPNTLKYGELAYSFNSGQLFIGNSSNSAISIGGNSYNEIINAATALNAVNTLVKRDSSGNFAAGVITASLLGNATTASSWQTGRTIGIIGDATGNNVVDGSADVNINITLANTTIAPGSYGSSVAIPVFNVDSKGRLTYAANAAISTYYIAKGDDDSNTRIDGGETITFEGGDGITTSVTENKVTFNVDNTVVRTSGNQNIAGDLVVTGDLFVNGNTTAINTSTLDVEDSLIRLANNNVDSDTLDIGFYGSANSGTLGYYGIARSVSDNGNFFVFKNIKQDPTGNVISSSSLTYANTGTLRASLTGGTVSGLNSAIGVADGGTGLDSVTTGDILYSSSTNTLSALGIQPSGNVLISGSTPSWGKIDLTTHVSGILPVVNGGTNNTSIGTAGSVAYSDGTRYNFSNVGSEGNALVSGASNSPTFGVLDLRGGGLGFTSANSNSAIFYTGSGNVMSYTNTPTDGQVLQFDVSSGLKFSHLDGGSF